MSSGSTSLLLYSIESLWKVACSYWNNFYYASPSGEKSYMLSISPTRKENRIPASYPNNNLKPQCSLELSCLCWAFYLNITFRSFNKICFTGVTMKKCHFRMAKLLEPSIKRNRTVIDWFWCRQTCSAGIKPVLKFS